MLHWRTTHLEFCSHAIVCIATNVIVVFIPQLTTLIPDPTFSIGAHLSRRILVDQTSIYWIRDQLLVYPILMRNQRTDLCPMYHRTINKQHLYLNKLLDISRIIPYTWTVAGDGGIYSKQCNHRLRPLLP